MLVTQLCKNRLGRAHSADRQSFLVINISLVFSVIYFCLTITRFDVRFVRFAPFPPIFFIPRVFFFSKAIVLFPDYGTKHRFPLPSVPSRMLNYLYSQCHVCFKCVRSMPWHLRTWAVNDRILFGIYRYLYSVLTIIALSINLTLMSCIYSPFLNGSVRY